MTSLILSLLFVVIVAFSALVGFARGLSKTVIRLITFALAIAATFILSGTITSTIAESVKLEGLTLGETILSNVQGDEMIGGIIESSPLLEEAILTVPEFIIGFLVFPVAFILLSFISWILFLILSKPLRKLFFKEEGKVKVSAGKRFAGFGIGAVTGVLLFAMLMAPLFGIISVLPEKSALEKVVDTLEEQGTLDSETAALVKGELSLLESPIYTASSALGITPVGKAYLTSVSKIERDGEVTYLTDEFGPFFAVVETAVEGELVTALQNSANDQTALYTALSNEEFMKELLGDMFNSKLLRSAIPEVTAIALEATARMLGVPENKIEVYDNMMSDIATLVKDSDIDFDAIAAYEEAHNITYVDVMYADNDNSLMTEEEYKKEIEKLNNLEKKISTIVDKNVAGGSAAVAEGIAKSFVKTVKDQVKKEGAESLKSFDPSKAQQKMSEIKIEDIVAEGENTSFIADMLEKIQTPELFETKLATVETVRESIRNSVKEAVKDDDKSAETANTLASVVSNFAGAAANATDENGNFDTMKLDFEKVGNAIGALQGSTLNSVGSTVLDIVVSGDLGDDEMIGSALGSIKDAYEEGHSVSDAVKIAGDIIHVIHAMTNNEGEATDDYATAFKKLVEGLTENSIDLFSKIFTKDVLASFGITDEHSDTAFEIIKTFLYELMALKNEGNFDNEMNAVIALYNKDVREFATYALNSKAIYNTLESIEASNPFGLDMGDEASREAHANSLEEYYNEEVAKATDKQRVYDIYTDIARFFGLEDIVELKK